MHSTAPRLWIACTRPGLLRGGVAHPAIAGHALDAFTAPQLAELHAEPAISIVVGHRLLPEHVEDFLRLGETSTRTRVEGSKVNTDAGASAVTEVLAASETARTDATRAAEAAPHKGARARG